MCGAPVEVGKGNCLELEILNSAEEGGLTEIWEYVPRVNN